MKKFFSLLLFVVIVISCVSVPVLAKNVVTTTTGMDTRYFGSALEDKAYVTFRSNDTYLHHMRFVIGLKDKNGNIRGDVDHGVYFDGVSTSYSHYVDHSFKNKVYYKHKFSLY